MSLERFLISVFVVGISALSGCSTDPRGLGSPDGGGTGGSRPGSGGIATGGATSGTGGVAPASGGTTGSSGGALGNSGGATGSSGGATGSSGGGATGSGGRATGGRVGTGGAGSGGSATGGRGGRDGGSGGSVTGGRSGSGGGSGGAGSGGRGAGGGGGSKPECATASDCKLVSDCCTCRAMPVGEAAPACSLVCIQSKCAAQQLPTDAVACVAGRCIAGFNCDASNVTCKIAVPACNAGEVPAVNEAGTCYAGGCVAASQCKTVTSCAACTGANEACATFQNRSGSQLHCVSVPAACGGGATCACMGQTVCVAPFTSCNDLSGIRGISCGCPTC